MLDQGFWGSYKVREGSLGMAEFGVEMGGGGAGLGVSEAIVKRGRGTGRDERRGRARRAWKSSFWWSSGVNLKAVKKVGVLPVAISQVEVRQGKSHKISHLCTGSECIPSFSFLYPKSSIQPVHSSPGKMKGLKPLTIVIKLGEPLHFI